MDGELEHFKTNVDLRLYAGSLGYEVDKRESSRLESIMRKGPDKISIRRDSDGHYVYYSFRDERDNGTIIDFVASRRRKNLGEVRKILRAFSGSAAPAAFEPLEPAPRFDRDKVRAEIRTMKALQWHRWLEEERKLPRPVLLSPRFRGRLLVDARANVIFLHEDEDGPCGFERRNNNFKGFASLGKKGLWLSAQFPSDRKLVVGESAIDCLSYQAVFKEAKTRYASLAGGLNPEQPALLARLCQAMPPGSEVVGITHPDPDGERYAEAITAAAAAAGLPFRNHRPEFVKDWNDDLRRMAALELPSFPAAL